MSVTAKKKLRDLVERMSEREAEALLEKAEEVDRDPLLELLENAPLDDEPLTAEDEEAIRVARAEVQRGEVFSADARAAEMDDEGRTGVRGQVVDGDVL
jgi:hypothetical protein